MNPSPSAWNPIFPPKNKQIPVPILPLQDPLSEMQYFVNQQN
jgi:hypothetical protein